MTSKEKQFVLDYVQRFRSIELITSMASLIFNKIKIPSIAIDRVYKMAEEELKEAKERGYFEEEVKVTYMCNVCNKNEVVCGVFACKECEYKPPTAKQPDKEQEKKDACPCNDCNRIDYCHLSVAEKCLPYQNWKKKYS